MRKCILHVPVMEFEITGQGTNIKCGSSQLYASRTLVIEYSMPRIYESNPLICYTINPSDTTHSTAEWVCPDCDYFEEAEGD